MKKKTVDDLRENWLNPIDSLEDKYPNLVDEVNQELENNFEEIFLELVFDYSLPKTDNILIKFASSKDIDINEICDMKNELQNIYNKELIKYKSDNFNELFKNKLNN